MPTTPASAHVAKQQGLAAAGSGALPVRLGLSPADRPGLLLAALWPIALVWFGLWQTVLRPEPIDAIWTLHQQVLAGTAPSPYQYQMWIHDLLLGPVAALVPHRNPATAYVATYAAWYALGLVLASLGSYVLARQFAGRLASTGVVLLLCALLPAFWYDNLYHPGDPWGWLATLLATWAIVVRPSLPLLTLALFAAGFAWEKNATLPATLLLAAWLRPSATNATRLRAAVQTAPLLVAAAVGPILPRLIYGTERGFTGARSFAIRDAVPFVFGLMLLVGPAVWQLWRERHDRAVLAREQRWLLAQLPLWLGIYTVAISAILTEIRSISVVFFYAIPLTARALQALTDTEPLYPALAPSDGLLPGVRTWQADAATKVGTAAASPAQTDATR